jgi:hypothetical protein
MMPMKKKTFMAAIAISVLIFSVVGAQLVRLSEANFHSSGPDIVIKSPANGATYNNSGVFVDLMILTDGTNFYSPTFAICRLDWGSFINVTLLNPRHNNQWFGEGTFYNVSQANHTLNVEVHIVSPWFPGQEGKSNANSTFSVDLSTPSPAPTPSPTQKPTQNASATPTPTISPNPTPSPSPTISPTLTPISTTIVDNIPLIDAGELIAIVVLAVSGATLIFYFRRRR